MSSPMHEYHINGYCYQVTFTKEQFVTIKVYLEDADVEYPGMLIDVYTLHKELFEIMFGTEKAIRVLKDGVK